MSRDQGHEIAAGAVVEFYESKEIVCGLVLAVKDTRFNVLSERNREVGLTPSRIVFRGKLSLDLHLSRDELLEKLSAISRSRRETMEQVKIDELWALLEGENEGFDAGELAEFVFNSPVSDAQAAAVQRVLLQDRLYFQPKDSRFYPRSAENVEQRRVEMEREAERQRKLALAAQWAGAVWNRKAVPALEFHNELIEWLKNFALFAQEAREAAFVKEFLKTAGIAPQPQSAFRILVKLGIWNEDENLLLHEHGICAEFPRPVLERAEELANRNPLEAARGEREDLTELHVFTVDGLLTRDYDDALSVRELGGGLVEVGIHIADAAEFVSPGDPCDIEAEQRASSIYLPDRRISMLPASLSEGLFSLRAGEDRLALSFLFTVDAEANIQESRIVPSLVRVREQLSYQDVDTRVDEDPRLKTAFELARRLRDKRLEQGAIVLPLPEIQVYVNSAGMIQISRYEKETPGQVLVSEWMIEANAAAAGFLAERGIPAVFRGQSECRQETEFVQSPHELFAIYRRRRLLARAELSSEPKPHCSLAIPHYTTATSPIRRYSDLVVQRQVKCGLSGNVRPHSKEEIDQLITKISATQSRIFMIQRKWTRYWLLKYMEQEDIESLNALVLDKNSRYAHLLIPDMLLEANAPVPEGPKVYQGEMVRIRIEKVVPREDILKVQIVDAPAR